MILLTGAAGKTGRAILSSLKKQGSRVRVFVRSPEQFKELSDCGATDFTVGDLHDSNALERAARGCENIYYICPNVSPDEVQIGLKLLESARKNNVQRFVYHSVLHPQIEAMPHHWQKMRFEEQLFESGMNFTILQPCAYMQNVLSSWKSIVEQGIYAIPYSTTSRISMVDLDDIADAAANILLENKHNNAIYELAGPEALSQDDVATILTNVIGIDVKAKTIDRKIWAENARKDVLSETQIDLLIKMFEYYEKFGLVGNSNVLELLIGRHAGTFTDFVKRQITLNPMEALAE
jgi:uncharacterized protein YbjT (DUF2867 family)